jgi:SlyX protein
LTAPRLAAQMGPKSKDKAMTDSETLARIDALEMRIAYQDQTIEDLNTAITDQWKQIDLLKRLVSKLTDQLEETQNNAGFSAQPEPPPPHY